MGSRSQGRHNSDRVQHGGWAAGLKVGTTVTGYNMGVGSRSQGRHNSDRVQHGGWAAGLKVGTTVTGYNMRGGQQVSR